MNRQRAKLLAAAALVVLALPALAQERPTSILPPGFGDPAPPPPPAPPRQSGSAAPRTPTSPTTPRSQPDTLSAEPASAMATDTIPAPVSGGSEDQVAESD